MKTGPLGGVSTPRNVAAFAVVLCGLVFGVWTVVKVATERLLYQHATSTASGWAHYVAVSVGDLQEIAAGEQPSAASMTFFRGAVKAGRVFRYEIFNREGFSQLISDHDSVAPVDLSELNPDAARAMRSGEPIVAVHQGDGADRPVYFAEAYVPVVIDGQQIAVVAAYVDQTEQRDIFYRTFLVTAVALCLLVGLSFIVPAVAWYRRTKQKQIVDRQLRFLAHHDALTGLANRVQLLESLEKALAARCDQNHQVAVYFIDLDRFKSINDTYGHDGGDFFLKSVAECLRTEAGRDNLIARLGGDEFVVVQFGLANAAQAEIFAARLLGALARPLAFRGQKIKSSGSIGISLAPRDGTETDRILKNADLALYKCKAAGRNRIFFFEQEMEAELQERIELEDVLRAAVLDEGFVLHYQPLFETRGRCLVGYEALIRLPRSNGALIPPLEFLPLAEELRLIEPIGAWVLREACKRAALWPQQLTVAVNLSPAQLGLGVICGQVAEALGSSGIEPRRLELEITENLLLTDSHAVMDELFALKALGVSIVLDDFGVGYSCLNYLTRFPFDKIKLDKSFMRGLDQSNDYAKTVVRSIIALGRQLGMRVTVEGVETAEQAQFVYESRGDQVQGYYFGRPTPAPELAGELTNHLRPANDFLGTDALCA